MHVITPGFNSLLYLMMRSQMHEVVLVRISALRRCVFCEEEPLLLALYRIKFVVRVKIMFLAMLTFSEGWPAEFSLEDYLSSSASHLSNLRHTSDPHLRQVRRRQTHGGQPICSYATACKAVKLIGENYLLRSQVIDTVHLKGSRSACPSVEPHSWLMTRVLSVFTS